MRPCSHYRLPIRCRARDLSSRLDPAPSPHPHSWQGRAILSQPPAKVVADFPWGGSEKTLLYLNRIDLAELDSSLSLVVLCEHLLPRSPDCSALEDVLEKVSDKFSESAEVLEGRWPKLKLIMAPGPPSEPCMWLRAEAHLPQLSDLRGGTSGDPLEVLIIDSTGTAPCAYMMKGICQLWGLPFSLACLLGDEGRLLSYFVSAFYNDIRPSQGDETSELQRPPARSTFGLVGTAAGVASRVAQDATADRRLF